MSNKPYLIKLNKIGRRSEGYICVTETKKNIPFKIKRVFWTYYTPESVTRGRHAHLHAKLVLIAVAGKIVVQTEMPDGEADEFELQDPSVGLFIPPRTWHTMKYSYNAVQLVIASSIFIEKDYRREYTDFKKM